MIKWISIPFTLWFQKNATIIHYFAMYSIFITLLVITIKPFAMRLSYLCINLVMGRKNGWRPKSVLTEKKIEFAKNW